MTRYRLTRSAKGDIGSILRTSEQRHGQHARSRYAALLLAAIRHIADSPTDVWSRDRSDLRPGIRSFHVRHSRNQSTEEPVTNPVHVVFYRVVGSGLVEIVRVLHDRMEPTRHVESVRDVE